MGSNKPRIMHLLALLFLIACTHRARFDKVLRLAFAFLAPLQRKGDEAASSMNHNNHKEFSNAIYDQGYACDRLGIYRCRC
ncbi:hypothetical protein SAMN05192556_107227 [Halomonas caseinilytica]|uniref:Uncharacterized protein n=1 Tax=Halomonas caseinilytica TaxID=438744 RepID=A0A1M6XR74_9GAMM|nr:hypothetical protein SAMN05192556_107227 [Halomonas caseinilytica]